MARKDRYSKETMENIAKEKSKKNARRKAIKKMNAHLRAYVSTKKGVKFSKKDACYS